MTATEEIQDFVSYLIEDRGVKSILELDKEDTYKLAYWVLVKHKMYDKVVSLMQEPFTAYYIHLAKMKAEEEGKEYRSH